MWLCRVISDDKEGLDKKDNRGTLKNVKRKVKHLFGKSDKEEEDQAADFLEDDELGPLEEEEEERAEKKEQDQAGVTDEQLEDEQLLYWEVRPHLVLSQYYYYRSFLTFGKFPLPDLHMTEDKKEGRDRATDKSLAALSGCPSVFSMLHPCCSQLNRHLQQHYTGVSPWHKEFDTVLPNMLQSSFTLSRHVSDSPHFSG